MMIFEDWGGIKVLSPRRFFGVGVDGCPPLPFRGQDASAPLLSDTKQKGAHSRAPLRDS